MTAAAVCAAVCLIACGGAETGDAASPAESRAGIAASDSAAGTAWADMKPDRSMELVYADQFSVEYYGDVCELVTIEGTGRYLIVEEGQTVPDGLPADVTVIRKPLSNVYLAASSAMDFVDALSATQAVTMTSTKKEDWSIASAVSALDSGDMIYVGKYSAPDYEALLMEECSLAVESTMIYHTPEVREKIESLGVPVLIEHSSYESHPIGRTEWIRLYGLLFDREKEAESFFEEQRRIAEEVIAETHGAGNEDRKTGNTETEKEDRGAFDKEASDMAARPTAAFFYMTSSGLANVRKTGDYVAEMIRLAGGTYVPELPGMESENALSTMNMQMEDFYAGCVDADILIYNATIDGGLNTIDDLLDKSPLFADFKAVKSGNVWCSEQDMFQHTTASAGMIREMHLLITGRTTEDFTYFHRVSTQQPGTNDE